MLICIIYTFTLLFQEREMKSEIAKKDLEIEDLRTHLETLLDEEEREKRLSSCSDCKTMYSSMLYLL